MMTLTGFCFISCGDDDEDEPQATSTAQKFVGFWEIDGIKNANQKNGVSIAFILFKEGKMRLGTNTEYENWTYNDKTGILATTYYVNSVNLQWEITLSVDDQWTGIGLWDATRSTSVAKWKNKDGRCTRILLAETNWVNVNNSNKKFNMVINKGDEFKVTGSAMPDGKRYPRYTSEEYDAKTDVLTIYESKAKFLKIRHPFSLNECRMRLSGYNYIEDGEYKLVR